MTCFSLQVPITDTNFTLILPFSSHHILSASLAVSYKIGERERTKVKLIAVNLIFTYSELFVQPSGESSPLCRSLRLGYICTGHWPQLKPVMLAWHTWPGDREPKQTVFVTFVFWSQGCILPFLHYDTIYGLRLSCLWLLAFRIKWHELWICNQIFCAQAHTNEHAHKQTLHTLKQVPYPRGKVVNITQRSRNHNKDPGNKMWYFRVSLSLSVSIHPACMELPANLADTMPPFRGMASAIYLWSHSTNCGDKKVVSAGAYNA